MSGSGQTLTLPIDWGALFRVKCAYCGVVRNRLDSERCPGCGAALPEVEFKPEPAKEPA